MAPVSRRLETVLELLGPCRCLGDIGTDHGLVPAHALMRGLTERAVAVDLRAAPLAVARRTLEARGLSERVALVQGDGLAPLVGLGVDAVVLAGMSGQAIERICTRSPEVLSGVEQLIVQPNTGAWHVRAFAAAAGFHLREERMIFLRGRFFVVCAFGPGTGPDDAYANLETRTSDLYRLGPLLVRRRDAVALRYYQAQRRRLDAFVKQGLIEHAAELATFEVGCSYFA